jgi:hypothetical protein
LAALKSRRGEDRTFRLGSNPSHKGLNPVASKDDLMIWVGRSVSDAALTTRLNAARSAIGDFGEE